MKLVLITLILFTTFTAWSKPCSITVHPKIYTISENISTLTKDVIKESNCERNVQLDFVRFLITTQGVVSSSQLARMFNSIENKKVTIHPKKISINKLEDFLTERIAFSKNWFVKNISTAARTSAVILSEEESLQVDCPSCSFPGNKSIRIISQNPISNTNKVQIINAKVLIKTVALIPRGMIQVNNQSLSSSMFKEEEAFVDNPAQVFTNKKSLVFYKVNKPLNGEKPLLISDLVPVSIVKAGTPASITLSQDGISLKSTAIPLRNGKYGEMIQLRSSRSKKIITGKVIDYNKVAIEL
ncbi:flagellar basal body P-ring formation chaperone FlgA [Halobacteriovorax sp. HLS]|uniref:flagellar basal body P-ring formation chaperone FlgA n=1 Tax=Halobacteriovorax sp. HLS TaxID=2234000 RepID=UPI000FD6DDD2|nr:flagellar basal body P-ring formation chaperone FlgA [Halobacteriovorax sp. HLS]